MKRLLIYLTAIMLGLSSCEGYLDKLPLNTPSDQTFLATETEMQMALAGCYSALWLNH